MNITNRISAGLVFSLRSVSVDVLVAGATELCPKGEIDLGARYQGMEPKAGESYPTTWFVSTDDDSDRVFHSVAGRSNADIEDGWAVAYLPPDIGRSSVARPRGGELAVDLR